MGVLPPARLGYRTQRRAPHYQTACGRREGIWIRAARTITGLEQPPQEKRPRANSLQVGEGTTKGHWQINTTETRPCSGISKQVELAVWARYFFFKKRGNSRLDLPEASSQPHLGGCGIIFQRRRWQARGYDTHLGNRVQWGLLGISRRCWGHWEGN